MSRKSYIDFIPFILLAPSVIFSFIFIVFPVAVLVLYSFHSGYGTGSLNTPMSVVNWTEFFTDSFYAEMLLKTMRLAAVTTIVSLVIGYLPAVALVRASPGLRIFLMIGLILPMWIAYIVRTMSWINILGREGVVNTILMKLNIINEPLLLLYNDFAIYMGLVHYVLPIMILNIFIGLQSVDKNVVDAARTLGANGLQAFLKVTFPISSSGVWAGCLLSFVLSAGAYVTPMLLGGPGSVYFPYVIYQSVIQELDWPLASVLALVFLGILSLALFIYGRYLGFSKVLKA